MVNKKSGRIADGLYCEELFHSYISGSRIGTIIKELYDNNENLLFPVQEPYYNIFSSFLPVYLYADMTVFTDVFLYYF